ncbi:Endonuclease/exonuclease/phosphatase [Pseudomassariella vexata]|uniref:DNA-(apurinic or apyrimidinic site) endonuclease 2 n=1 Tax=Pseudomassariella vexata TaxID=1141098 RepID=A0A1Y2E8F7_9PEZI|nr:Endonuclease/exonuclease/phosphatase [Pseudomassariella vexata]ORY67717.1 Endonuclease/exonuclease/phosphatase [Pseudomassariella vexata]
MVLRITSWNVNGIKNPFGYQPWRENRTFEAMFDILEADIVVMQETKIQRKDLTDDMVLVPGWDVYFSFPKHKKGYAGVAIYTRSSVCAPIRAEEGITGVLCPPNSSTKFSDLPKDQQIGGYPTPGQLTGTLDNATLDSEGRCVILEFPAFVLIGTYSPANRDETRDDFRLGYLEALDLRIRNLVGMGKNVVLTGDLNVIRAGIDTANIAERLKKEAMAMQDFFSSPARRLFNHMVFDGVVHGERDESREDPVLWDLGRLFNPTRQGMFTCWDTKKNTRPANFGSRIDYVLCSAGMKDWVVDSNIQEGLMGSDHCPVYASLNDVVKVDGKEIHLKDIMNPEGMFRAGKRLRNWSKKDLRSMSAKLIPEFDNRRSIKDMFSKKAKVVPTPASVSEPEPASSEPIPSAPLSSQAESTTSSVSLEKPANAGSKRTPSAPAPNSRPQKKLKASPVKEKASSRGQSSLMGFFKSKTTASPDNKKPETEENPTPGTDVDDTSAFAIEEAGNSRASNTVDDSNDPHTPIRAEKFIDPIESKESWSKLLGKRVVPKCEHGEPCISLVTKKAGVNCGRSFYMCPRPIGPSGEKEKNTEWRCGTFIWSSDWSKSQSA